MFPLMAGQMPVAIVVLVLLIPNRSSRATATQSAPGLAPSLPAVRLHIMPLF